MASPVPALFGTNVGLPGSKFLREPCSMENASPWEVQALIMHLGGSLTVAPESYQVVLDADACSALVGFLDKRAKACSNPLESNDLRVTLTEDELVGLVGAAAFEKVASTFGTTFDVIKLRRVTASLQCIAFHCDFSKRTMQVALNAEEDYEGGRLVFATADGFVQPGRPAGSATVHVNCNVHGVTTLRSGVRYGLFLCDTKGVGLTNLQYLVEPSLAQFDFFQKAVTLLGSATDEQIKFWVQNYAKLLLSGGLQSQPCLELEVVWRTHLLSPLLYVQTCLAIGAPGIIDHCPSAVGDYVMLEDGATSCGVDGMKQDEIDCSIDWLGLDLVAAVREHEKFMRSMLHCDIRDTTTMSMVVAEYCRFLDVVKHSIQEPVPSPIIDLVWHTHMLFPRRYAAETRELAGSFVNHEGAAHSPHIV